MVRGEPKTEVELKSEHHRKDHEKHVKAKNERLERHSGTLAYVTRFAANVPVRVYDRVGVFLF